ncbi:iron chaperone [Streptomyces sp. NPDC059443]|uniref:iron chaperone n=1 Tax=unclassified Streptomyces TaxID=2593676 RepID=UPI0036864077
MTLSGPSVGDYLAGVPEPRREALTRLRELCVAELTGAGFEEVIAYGMPAYRRGGVAELAWASQKQYVSVYLMRSELREAFAERLAAHDMGKGCLRFRRVDAMDWDLLRDLLRATATLPAGPACG